MELSSYSPIKASANGRSPKRDRRISASVATTWWERCSKSASSFIRDNIVPASFATAGLILKFDFVDKVYPPGREFRGSGFKGSEVQKFRVQRFKVQGSRLLNS